MKAGGPLKRRTALARGTTELKRSPIARGTTELKRTELARSTKPIPQQTAKRKAARPDRDAVRAEVIRRADYRCQYRVLVPEVPCGWLPSRRRLEVDELRGGSWRGTEWLDPDQCRACCPVHHDWKTDHKRELLRRLARHEGAAHEPPEEDQDPPGDRTASQGPRVHRGPDIGQPPGAEPGGVPHPAFRHHPERLPGHP